MNLGATINSWLRTSVSLAEARQERSDGGMRSVHFKPKSFTAFSLATLLKTPSLIFFVSRHSSRRSNMGNGMPTQQKSVPKKRRSWNSVRNFGPYS